MSKQYDLIVYIGRFQPWHNGHVETVKQAQRLAENVLILVGSERAPQSFKNPFTIEQRTAFIWGSIDEFEHPYNIFLSPIRDYTYDENEWVLQVGKKITEVANQVEAKKIAIIGYDKDDSTYYLKLFPQYDFIPSEKFPRVGNTIDATKIRTHLFEDDIEFIRSVVPENVFNDILEFRGTDKFNLLQEEYDFVKSYKKMWSVAPYEPIFVTVDSVVVQSGHVLLIQRGAFPGKGMWAMPGGFIEPTEQLLESAIRELREETKLKVPEKVLKGSVVAQQVFAKPDRSPRGRTITHVYMFQLDDGEKLPKVKGSDDAMNARWIPFSDFDDMEPVMNEDHWHIVQCMLNQPK